MIASAETQPTESADTLRRRANAEAKASLSPDEIHLVRQLVLALRLRGAASRLRLAPATLLRILSGLPVHNGTAAHLRAQLG